MKGDLPVSLQCRALDAFAIGKLVLVPGSDCLEDVKGVISETRFPTLGKKIKAKESIHSAMMSKVHANFYEVPRDGRCKTDAKSNPPAATYTITSPLLRANSKKGDEIKTAELHPFWAVIRQLSSKLAHNMELAEEYFVLPHIEMKGLSKSTLQTVVKLPVLRNITPINTGDLLTLPFNTAMEEEDEDNDE